MKLAVVTGSSGGIGQSVCKVLAVRASEPAASASVRVSAAAATRLGARRRRDSLPRARVRA